MEGNCSHRAKRTSPGLAYGYSLRFNVCEKTLKNTLSDKETAVVLAAAHSLLLLNGNDACEVYYAVLMRRRKSTKGLLAEGERTLKDPKKMAELGFEEGIGYVPFGGFGYTALKQLRKDDVSPIRAAAAKVLAKDPDPRSAGALVQAASDKSWTVRAAAVDAIAERGDSSLLEDIVPAMSDHKGLVRYTAAAAVIRLSTIPGSPLKESEKQKAEIRKRKTEGSDLK
jgi:hypothetical protein